MHPPQECVKVKPKYRKKVPKNGQKAYSQQGLGMDIQTECFVEHHPHRQNCGCDVQGMHPGQDIQERTGRIPDQENSLIGALPVGVELRSQKSQTKQSGPPQVGPQCRELVASGRFAGKFQTKGGHHDQYRGQGKGLGQLKVQPIPIGTANHVSRRQASK